MDIPGEVFGPQWKAEACSAAARWPKDGRRYLELKALLIGLGYGEEITWSENIDVCSSADDFALEHAFVVCNSGMKAQIAREIFTRVKVRLLAGVSAGTGFGHKAKAAAIDHVWRLRFDYFSDWDSTDHWPIVQRVDWLALLPWIGDITKYHLAKNLGVDCCKPDRHLVRIAAAQDTTPAQMCERLAKITGDRVATVDSVIWRAANLGLV